MLPCSAAVDTGEGPTHARFYDTRARVWKMLTGMGVPVPQPQLEEGLCSYQPAQLRIPVIAAGALVCLLVTWRRLRRWLLNRWTILVPLLAVLTISIVWFVSTRRFDEWVLDGGNRQRLASFDHHLQYAISREWSGTPRFIHGGFPLNDATKTAFDARTNTIMHVMVDRLDRVIGSYDINSEVDEFEAFRKPQSCWEHAGIAVVKGTCKDSTGTFRPYTALRVHYGDLLGLALFPVVVSLAIRTRNAVRLRRRTRLGLCKVCGYDLRTSTGRCPECGTACRPIRTVAQKP